jgi:hypothetical protein
MMSMIQPTELLLELSKHNNNNNKNKNYSKWQNWPIVKSIYFTSN